jgi:hypothetical protein
MSSGAPDREGQFIVDGHSIHVILLGSQVSFLGPRHSGR